MKNNLKNNYQFFKNNISIESKNKIAKQKQKHYKKLNTDKNAKKEKRKKIKLAIQFHTIKIWGLQIYQKK